MEIGHVTKTVVSKGRKQKRSVMSSRMHDTQMVVYKTYLGKAGWSSKTKHELV
jgi:hypothetical protein